MVLDQYYGKEKKKINSKTKPTYKLNLIFKTNKNIPCLNFIKKIFKFVD